MQDVDVLPKGAVLEADMDFSQRDIFRELGEAYPGVDFSDGFRDAKTIKALRAQGYKPATNSTHKEGSTFDIRAFPSMSLKEGADDLRKRFPKANILYGDANHRDHVHVEFPGYTGAPTLGKTAQKVGADNPIDELPEGAVLEQDVDKGIVNPEQRGGLPKGTQVELNANKDSNPVFDREKWLMDNMGLTSNQEEQLTAWLNMNKGNKALNAQDIQNFYRTLNPNLDVPEDVIDMEAFHKGDREYVNFSHVKAEEAYRDRLQARLDRRQDEEGGDNNLEALADQGLASNLSDEVAGVGGGLGALTRGEEFSEGYTLARDTERLNLENAREEEGLLGTAAEIAGSVPTSILLPFAKAKSIGGLAAGGAVSGAAYGYGRGDGLGDSLGSAVIDAGIGSIAAPVAGKVLQKAGAKLFKSDKVDDVVEEVVEEAPPLTPEQKLEKAVEEVRPRRKEQDALNSEILSDKAKELFKAQQTMSGESGFFKSLNTLKGPLPKIEADSIRNQFSQEDIDSLYTVLKSGNLDPFEVVDAGRGLAKILGKDGFGAPTPSELKLLSEVFSPKLVADLMKIKPFKEQAKDFAGNALNLPRAIMSTLDLSAPLRQGVFMIGRKQFWKNWTTMFKSFGSEKAYASVMDNIAKSPNAALMRKHKLAITDLDGALADREEDFMSNWAEKIPVFGRAARASNRAYTAFLSKLRADVFDDLIEKSSKLGNDLRDDPKRVAGLAKYINNATGRGTLGSYEASAPLLNAVFFSPRMISARVSTLNPAYYVTMDPFVRKEAIRDLATFGAVASSVLTLANYSGAEVEIDPRSTNFGKIKIGDTRYDILGGFQQYLRFAAVVASNQTKKGSGEIKTLGEGYKPDTRATVVGKFARNKLSPPASYLADMLIGEDFLGEPFDPASGLAKRFVPMFLQDATEAFQEEGVVGLAKATPGAFGVGVSTYPTPRDSFGKVYSSKDTPDEVDNIVNELEDTTGKVAIGKPTKQYTTTDEDYDAYLEVSGGLIKQSLKDVVQGPEWAGATVQEKMEIIKEVKKEARKEARETLGLSKIK